MEDQSSEKVLVFFSLSKVFRVGKSGASTTSPTCWRASDSSKSTPRTAFAGKKRLVKLTLFKNRSYIFRTTIFPYLGSNFFQCTALILFEIVCEKINVNVEVAGRRPTRRRRSPRSRRSRPTWTRWSGKSALWTSKSASCRPTRASCSKTTSQISSKNSHQNCSLFFFEQLFQKYCPTFSRYLYLTSDELCRSFSSSATAQQTLLLIKPHPDTLIEVPEPMYVSVSFFVFCESLVITSIDSLSLFRLFCYLDI